MENTPYIHMIRHGKSEYNQPLWEDISTADDLVNKVTEIERISHIAKNIKNDIALNEVVAIWASPTGRTLETAKILSIELTKLGTPIRRSENNYGVSIFDQIGEVKNFSWPILNILVKGGIYNYKGNDFTIDKNLTNPSSLNSREYFINDMMHKLDNELRHSLPVDLLKKIDSIESFESVTKRIDVTLNRLIKLSDKRYRIILVTHDALISQLVFNATDGLKLGIDPSSQIKLRLNQLGELEVWQIGDDIL